MELVIGLIVLAVLYWVVQQIPLPIPSWLVNVLFALVALYIIMQAFGIASPFGLQMPR